VACFEVTLYTVSVEESSQNNRSGNRTAILHDL